MSLYKRRSALLKDGSRGELKRCAFSKHGVPTWRARTCACTEATPSPGGGPAVARLQPLRPQLQFPEAPSARGRGEQSLFGARDPKTPLRDWPRGGDVRRGGGGRRAIETAEER